MNKLLIICGPTGTGKTNLALQMAKQFNGELVSCDSRQVYKGMDIITGKDIPQNILPTIKKLNSIPNHSQEGGNLYRSSTNFEVPNEINIPIYIVDTIPIWGYDLVSPDQEFSVAHYQDYALTIIADIHRRGKLPILVGGTGFYIDAVVTGIGTTHVPRNDAVRLSLESLPLDQLQRRLEDLSPNVFHAMNDSDKQNPRRLIRKIEIATSGIQEKSPTSMFDTLWLGLTLPKDEQEKRIKERVIKRIANGAIEEIQNVVAAYSWDTLALQAIGYQEWKKYLENPTHENYQTAVDNWQTHEIQYAKRQMTWFKKKKAITWYDPSSQDYELMVRNQIQSWYNEFA